MMLKLLGLLSLAVSAFAECGGSNCLSCTGETQADGSNFFFTPMCMWVGEYTGGAFCTFDDDVAWVDWLVVGDGCCAAVQAECGAFGSKVDPKYLKRVELPQGAVASGHALRGWIPGKASDFRYGHIQSGSANCACSIQSCTCSMEVFAQEGEFIKINAERLNLGGSAQVLHVEVDGVSVGQCGALGDMSPGCGQEIQCAGFAAVPRIAGGTTLLSAETIFTGSNALVVSGTSWNTTDFAFTATIKTTAGGVIFGKTLHTAGDWRHHDKVLYVQNGVVKFAIGWVGDMSGTTNIADGSAHVVSLSLKKSTNTWKLYVDRVLEATQVLDPMSDPADSINVIGHGANNRPGRTSEFGSSYFIGSISKVKWYSGSSVLPDQHVVTGTIASSVTANTCNGDDGPIGRRMQLFTSVVTSPKHILKKNTIELTGGTITCKHGMVMTAASDIVCSFPSFPGDKFLAVGNCSRPEKWAQDHIAAEAGFLNASVAVGDIRSEGIRPGQNEQLYKNGQVYFYSDPSVNEYWARPSFFQNGNCAGATLTLSGPLGSPAVALNVSVSALSAGTELCGYILSALYTFYDADGDAEGVTTFQWLRATDEFGGDAVEIIGASGSSYLPGSDDIGMYIYLEVTPKAISGWTVGAPVRVFGTYVGLSFC